MKMKAVVHEAEEGGFWAKFPPFRAVQTMEELLRNLHEAIEGCLSPASEIETICPNR
jgi:predicted RNase H-like HicB family nuclease